MEMGMMLVILNLLGLGDELLKWLFRKWLMMGLARCYVMCKIYTNLLIMAVDTKDDCGILQPRRDPPTSTMTLQSSWENPSGDPSS